MQTAKNQIKLSNQIEDKKLGVSDFDLDNRTFYIPSSARVKFQLSCSKRLKGNKLYKDRAEKSRQSTITYLKSISEDCEFVTKMELEALLTKRRRNLIINVYIISVAYLIVELENSTFY